MSNLTIKEMMAIAVLKGDDVAAYALADMIQENRREGLEIIKPYTQNIDVDNIRAILYYKDEYDINHESSRALHRVVTDWLSGKTESLHLVGVERIELYSFPITKREEIIDDDKRKNRPRIEPSDTGYACYRG